VAGLAIADGTVQDSWGVLEDSPPIRNLLEGGAGVQGLHVAAGRRIYQLWEHDEAERTWAKGQKIQWAHQLIVRRLIVCASVQLIDSLLSLG